jgi:DNA-binding Lrp family transcriptional regulator
MEAAQTSDFPRRLMLAGSKVNRKGRLAETPILCDSVRHFGQNAQNDWQIDQGLEMTPDVPNYSPDDLDRRLIAHLRLDGRASLSKLSDALGVARGTIQNRLARLLETGTIMGFTIRVREGYDGNGLHAIMMIEVVGKSTPQVIRKLRGFPEIQALHTTNGNWDLVANIRAASLSDFDRVLREVRMIEGVLNSETSLLLSTI